ncbi:ATP-grasp domain-containing protein, partial [Streptomyces sp. NPDC054956]
PPAPRGPGAAERPVVPGGRKEGAGPGPERAGGPGPVRVAPRAERGRVEAAWFAADDPLPFLAMLAAFLGRGAGKAGRMLRGVPEHGRRTARAVVRAPRQRGRERPAATASRPAPPEASAEPDELVTR